MLIITPIIPVESTRLLVDDKYFKNFRNKSRPKNSDVKFLNLIRIFPIICLQC